MMITPSKRIAFTLVLLLLAMGTVACDDEPTTSQTTRVSLLLTDGPGVAVDNVWIEVGEVYLQGSEGRVTLLSSSEGAALGQVNLSDLDDETLDMVKDVVVPSGPYGQLRFVVTSAVLQAGDNFYSYNGAVPPGEDPETFELSGDLKCPSCSQSGLKVLLPQDELPIEGDQKIIVLDFDIARSFGRQAGMSGQWVMGPVIVATELGFTGGITGTVALAEGVTVPDCPADPATARDRTVFEATATAQNLLDDSDDPLVYSTNPDQDGNLTFGFLVPDTYDMGFTTPIAVDDDYQIVFDATVDPTEIDVSSGGQASVEYTIESAVCEPIP